jgi:hypothetical protein
LVPRKYSPVPNTLDPYPPSDPSGAPGETGTGGGCGTTSELLGLRIGAGGTYGAGGTCADAIPTDKETVASERQQTRAKNIAVILTCTPVNIVRDKRFPYRGNRKRPIQRCRTIESRA